MTRLRELLSDWHGGLVIYNGIKVRKLRPDIKAVSVNALSTQDDLDDVCWARKQVAFSNRSLWVWSIRHKARWPTPVVLIR